MPHPSWKHRCPTRNGEWVFGPQHCPDCGQISEIKVWRRSMLQRIALYRQLTGLPPYGPHLRFLPPLTHPCEQCDGEGLVTTSDGQWRDCPYCNGYGNLISRTPEEMERIHRWAQRRQSEARTRPPDAPDLLLGRIPYTFNPLQTNSPEGFFYQIAALIRDHEQNHVRNQRIGLLLLACNDEHWDAFIYLIEQWEKAGFGLDVDAGSILLLGKQPGAGLIASLTPALSSLNLNYVGLQQMAFPRAVIHRLQTAIDQALGLPHGQYQSYDILLLRSFNRTQARALLKALITAASTQLALN